MRGRGYRGCKENSEEERQEERQEVGEEAGEESRQEDGQEEVGERQSPARGWRPENLFPRVLFFPTSISQQGAGGDPRLQGFKVTPNTQLAVRAAALVPIFRSA